MPWAVLGLTPTPKIKPRRSASQPVAVIKPPNGIKALALGGGLLNCRNIKVAQTKSGQIKVDQGILKQFFYAGIKPRQRAGGQIQARQS
jgi:hypothetical protein